MNAFALFAYGLFVTMIVFVAIGLLIWGAILDGRYDQEMREQRDEDETQANAPRRPVVAAARD